MKVEIRTEKDHGFKNYEPIILKNIEEGWLVLTTAANEFKDGKFTSGVRLDIFSELHNWKLDKFEVFHGRVTLSNN